MSKITDLTTKFKKNHNFLVEYYQKLFQKIDDSKHLNFFTELYFDEVQKKIKDVGFFNNYKNKSLFGIPFFLKDNFMVKNKKVSCGSNILSSFVATFSATVYELLEQKGAILLGKTTMDELSMGGTGLEANEGSVLNPLDQNRVVGGSSSGSAVAVSRSLCSFALGSDTGDSGRLPASYLGIIGFKPTLGLISRYGMIPYSPSLDTVAFFTKDIDDLELVSQALFQHDPKDLICQKLNLPSLLEPLRTEKTKILVIGLDLPATDPIIIKDFQKKVLQPLIVNQFCVKFHTLEPMILQNLTFLYQIISFSEALSSQANLTGVNFGLNEQDSKISLDFFDLIKQNRTKGFGSELKRRYVLGAFFTSKQYQKDTYFQAPKMRTYIQNYFDNLFKEYDFIIHLAASDVAPTIVQIQKFKTQRVPKLNAGMLLLIANFLGTASLVLPFTKKNNLPVGFNIFTKPNQDFQLINFAKTLEKIIKNEN